MKSSERGDPMTDHFTGSLAEAASEYAHRGYHVFPLEPRGKQPLGRLVCHGVKDASCDPTQVRRWWQLRPDANVGAACGHGLAVSSGRGL
jgi:Bifunctional DNA primase/polymerase, N-terminal